jgi:hypothetical protein
MSRLITNGMIFQVYRWVINLSICFGLHWLDLCLTVVPPAGTDGMKIRFLNSSHPDNKVYPCNT